MVQPLAQEPALEAEDYLIPYNELRGYLCSASSDAVLPKLRLLLKHHLDRLKSPWQPFGSPSTASPSAVSGNDLTVPNTTAAKISVDDTSRKLALQLSERVQIDELDAFLLVKSYTQYSLDGALPTDGYAKDNAIGERLERVVMWYTEESLAIIQIALAIVRLCQDDMEGWSDMAFALKAEMMISEASYIEGLFRAFSKLAQRELDEKERAESLFWATYQLRVQDAILQLLFLTLYAYPNRPAQVSEGLLRGAVMSSFGTMQSNRYIWESNTEAVQIQTRIRDLMLVIALESLCLTHLLGDMEEGMADNTVLGSKESIASFHHFILDQSADLDGSSEQAQEFPIWPMPIICMGWAIALHSMAPDFLPSTPTCDGPRLWQDMARRALRLDSGLFPWMQELLAGPLFERSGSEGGVDTRTSLRKSMKDLVIQIPTIVPMASIADRTGLYRVWELLFGGGSPSTSLPLCANYWAEDHHDPFRRAVLDESNFPVEPAHLPQVLAALSGVHPDANATRIGGTNPAERVFEYFSNLSTITIAVEPRWYRFTGKDSASRKLVEATRDLILPGGETIPQATRGVLLPNGDGSTHIVQWAKSSTFAGWTLLVEVLRAAAGLDPSELISSTDDDAVQLTVADLGLPDEPYAILDAGLKLLRAICDPVTGLADSVMKPIRGGGQSVLELVLIVLECGRFDGQVSQSALAVLQSLLATNAPHIWAAVRNLSVFSTSTRKRGIAANLVHQNSIRGEHNLTISILRLVRSLVNSMADTRKPDETLVKQAIQLVFTDIWLQFSAWRYQDATQKHEIASLVFDIFDTILSHPLVPDGSVPTDCAKYVVDVFITSASPLNYRPLVEILTQSGPLIQKLVSSRRETDAGLVRSSLEKGMSLLASCMRLAAGLNTNAQELPGRLLSVSVVGDRGDRLTLVDYLFEMTVSISSQETTKLVGLRLLRTYLESIAGSLHRASLAGLLRDCEATIQRVTAMLESEESVDLLQAAWQLLATIVETQPGCAGFCIGLRKEQSAGLLDIAVESISSHQDHVLDSQVLAAILSYLRAVATSPSAGAAIKSVRTNDAFWQAVFDIAMRPVPTPLSFTLSMHSEDFASRIRSYAHATQAKANATSLLAIEIRSSLDSEQEGESKAQSLVLGLWRNASRLEEAVGLAGHSSCNPGLHQEMGERLKEYNVGIMGVRTVRLATEREFGRTYRYDGNPLVAGDEVAQSTVNLALDMLNLNWSMLDADLSLTTSFLTLGEILADLVAGDQLAATASLRAASGLAEELSKEERGGDVMLAIQAQRLDLVAVLLDTAMDEEVEPDTTLMGKLAGSIRAILESSIFPPLVGMRHPDLPALHKPILRVLHLYLGALGRVDVIKADELLETATVLTLEAADVVLEAIIHPAITTPAPERALHNLVDSALIMGVLCEITRSPSTHIWLDRMSEFNLLTRSLEVVVRARITDGRLPAYIPSVLVLHLALASNPLSAEKLAVSGILPAYSDNAIAVEAEYGRITPLPDAQTTSVHSAWCSMLLVTKALLSSLPENSTGSFTRSDVLPFLRVCTRQLLKAMSWDGDTPFSQPMFDELESVMDVLYGVSRAIGANATLLADFAPPAINLLKSIRYVLSHPRGFAGIIVPASEDERAALEKELEGVDEEKQVDLLDFAATPILAGRILGLLRVVRTTILTLVEFTRAWETVSGDSELAEEVVLPTEDDPISASEDPIGVLSDLFVTTTVIINQFQTTSTTSEDAKSAREIALQIQDASALLATAQYMIRHSLLPEAKLDKGPESDIAMDVDSGSTKRASLGKMGEKERGVVLLRELEGDLRNILGGEDAPPGEVVGWLSGIVGRYLEGGEQ